jgi:hypothetical protein
MAALRLPITQDANLCACCVVVEGLVGFGENCRLDSERADMVHLSATTAGWCVPVLAALSLLSSAHAQFTVYPSATVIVFADGAVSSSALAFADVKSDW